MDKIINKNKVPKLRFGEFNNEWKEIKLKDLSTNISYGMNVPATDYDGENKYIRITDIDEETSLYTNNKVSPLGILDDKFLLKENDILFARTGASTGKTYLYDKEDGKLYYAGFLIKAHIKDNYIGKFIFEQTKLNKYYNWVRITSMRSGQPGINSLEYGNYKFAITSIFEQQKIANFFTLIDKKINLQTQKVELLKMYEKKFIKNLLNSNNKDWKNVTLKDCCLGFDHLRKPIISTQRKTGNIPYYGANGIQDYINDFLFDGEYILLAEDGGHFDEFFCKPIAQYINGKAWVNNHAHVIQGNNENCTKFLYYCLKHKDIRQYVNGTSRAKLNQDNMWKIRLKLPPLNKQIQISNTLSIFDKKILIQEKLKKRLEDLKKCLLQQMFI